MTLTEYIAKQTQTLIDSLEQQARRAESDTFDHGIHDFRVALRRLSENLRVFQDVFPSGAAKTVRKHLKIAMHAAGEARNHDVAADLLKKAELEVPAGFGPGREHAAHQLSLLLSTWNNTGTYGAWKQQLHV